MSIREYFKEPEIKQTLETNASIVALVHLLVKAGITTVEEFETTRDEIIEKIKIGTAKEVRKVQNETGKVSEED